MLRRPFITDFFITRSITRPRLLLALKNSGDVIICSSPQLQNPEDSSLSVAAEFHIRLPADCTGQQVSVPKPKATKEFSHSFFGYDPVLKQTTVLFINRDKDAAPEEIQILTLGTGKWRSIKSRLTHYPLSEGICINGVLYYVARRVVVGGNSTVVIACFDVKSENEKETFQLVAEANGVSIWSRPSVLVNFKGKLGGVQSEWRCGVDGRFSLELCLWVLEDVKKREWSKRVYVLPDLWEDDDVKRKASVSIAGVTAATGEIVLVKECVSNPFYFTTIILTVTLSGKLKSKVWMRLRDTEFVRLSTMLKILSF
ncbi:unnamed protein product [Microthlaspi erraticum]|uniref:F-box associated beta-propeller type 3 domain-containing protein n=1 Tax=Microthlaspi erraticum TaxID=1685480 RepID=A0A6D2LML1_9BRAS|nr:unnamed protein product [Microthlaspi erraticum]